MFFSMGSQIPSPDIRPGPALPTFANLGEGPVADLPHAFPGQVDGLADGLQGHLRDCPGRSSARRCPFPGDSSCRGPDPVPGSGRVAEPPPGAQPGDRPGCRPGSTPFSFTGCPGPGWAAGRPDLRHLAGGQLHLLGQLFSATAAMRSCSSFRSVLTTGWPAGPVGGQAHGAGLSCRAVWMDCRIHHTA